MKVPAIMLAGIAKGKKALRTYALTDIHVKIYFTWWVFSYLVCTARDAVFYKYNIIT